MTTIVCAWIARLCDRKGTERQGREWGGVIGERFLGRNGGNESCAGGMQRKRQGRRQRCMSALPGGAEKRKDSGALDCAGDRALGTKHLREIDISQDSSCTFHWKYIIQ